LRRRAFMTLLGGAATWPLAARAQQPRRIGLHVANYAQTDREGQANIAAFLATFQMLGWTDGRNVRIAYRWDGGDPERIAASAAELVHSAPDVIVVSGGGGLTELHRLNEAPAAAQSGSYLQPARKKAAARHRRGTERYRRARTRAAASPRTCFMKAGLSEPSGRASAMCGDFDGPLPGQRTAFGRDAGSHVPPFWPERIRLFE
jgi:hypothetical protein